MEKNISINYDNEFAEKEFAERVRYYLNTLKKKAMLERELKNLNKFLIHVDQNITEEMMDKGIGEHMVDGVKFTVVSDDKFSIDKDEAGTMKWDSDVFFKWLADIGEEALVKIEEKVHPATREAFLKEQLRRGTELPSWIIHKIYNHLKFNKSEIERQAGVAE